MKKLLLLFLLSTSLAFAQIEKMNVYSGGNSTPTSISIIDISVILFNENNVNVKTTTGDQEFSLTAIDRIKFTPTTLDIELYFYMDNGEMLTYKTSEFDEILFDTTITSVEDGHEAVAGEVSFTKGYPNPFSSSVNLEFRLDKPGDVEVTISDVNGTQLRTLLEENMATGVHSVVWDGLNSEGARVSAGSYICSVKLNNIVVTKKLIFVK